MDDLIRRDDQAIVPEITVDAADFAADAARHLDDVANVRVLRILVVRDGEVIAEIVGKGRTLKPMYGARVGGVVWVAEGDDLTCPAIEPEDLLDPLPGVPG